jgi:hypothetical protein
LVWPIKLITWSLIYVVWPRQGLPAAASIIAASFVCHSALPIPHTCFRAMLWESASNRIADDDPNGAALQMAVMESEE